MVLMKTILGIFGYPVNVTIIFGYLIGNSDITIFMYNFANMYLLTLPSCQRHSEATNK